MKLKASLVGLAAVLPLLFAGVASAAAPTKGNTDTWDYGYKTVAAPEGGATDPACPGTYDFVTTVYGWGSDVTLTKGNNLVYVNSNDNDVVTGKGNDCVVVKSNDNDVTTNAGDDTVVNSGKDNDFFTGSGNDTILDKGKFNNLFAGLGKDTCTYDKNTSDAFSCEQ